MAYNRHRWVNGKAPAINAENLNEIEDELVLLENRINGIATLPPGSTQGNAELVDIRVGSSGESYDNAGDAVRQQISKVERPINLLTARENNQMLVMTRLADVTENGTQKARIFLERNVGAEYTIVESGFIFVDTISENTPAGSFLTLENVGQQISGYTIRKVNVPNVTNPVYSYGQAIGKKTNGFSIRGFLSYTLDGANYVAYTPAITGNYGDGFGGLVEGGGSGGSGEVYSDTEHIIGTWFGQPLYARTLLIDDFEYDYVEKHLGSDIEVVAWDGIVKDPYSTLRKIDFSFSGSTGSIYSAIDAADSNKLVINCRGFTASSAIVTVKYIKPTD